MAEPAPALLLQNLTLSKEMGKRDGLGCCEDTAYSHTLAALSLGFGMDYKNFWSRGWSDGSAVKRMSFSSRGHGIESQPSHPSGTLVPGDLAASEDTAYMWYADHTWRQNTRAHKMFLFSKRNLWSSCPIRAHNVSAQGIRASPHKAPSFRSQ